MIDSLIEKFTNKERYKNGRIITSVNNTRSYKEIRNSLTRFTQEVLIVHSPLTISKRLMNASYSITHFIFRKSELRTATKVA